MSSIPAWVTQTPGICKLPTSTQARIVEIFRFCIVGGMNWMVDFTVFNLMRWLMPIHLVMVAKVVAATVAATFSWFVNRSWTFQKRATSDRKRELTTFMVVNAVGLTPPLVCLWVSHYLLGFNSVLADNISANVIGLILGTVLRYFGYRHLVFTQTTQD